MRRLPLIIRLITVLVGSTFATRPCLGLKSDTKVGSLYYAWNQGINGTDIGMEHRDGQFLLAPLARVCNDNRVCFG
jgi:hypothetical protein